MKNRTDRYEDKSGFFKPAMIIIIILCVCFLVFSCKNEKKPIPDNGWRVKEDTARYFTTQNGISVFGDTANWGPNGRNMNVTGTVKAGCVNSCYLEIVIRSLNGDMAMRDSFGNWRVEGDVKAILEQFYQSHILEKKEWKPSNKKISNTILGGDAGGYNLFYFNDSGITVQAPFQTDEYSTDPPTIVDHYRDRNGNDSSVTRPPAYMEKNEWPGSAVINFADSTIAPIDTTRRIEIKKYSGRLFLVDSLTGRIINRPSRNIKDTIK